MESKVTKTYFKIFIGDKIFLLDQKLEQPGKYPKWCWVKDDIINVHEDLTYETNLRFVLYNRMKVMGVVNREVEVG